MLKSVTTYGNRIFRVLFLNNELNVKYIPFGPKHLTHLISCFKEHSQDP